MRPNRNTPPPKIIGTSTTHSGTEHHYLRGMPVQIVGVHKQVAPGADDTLILDTDENLAAATA